MGRIKRFLHTALTYLAGNILSKLVTFFLIPLYTNKLSTTDYGDYDVVVTIITLLVSVAFFQLWDGMFRMSFEEEDIDDKYTVISICMKGYGIGLVLYSISYIVLARVLTFNHMVLPFLFGIVFGLQYMYSFAARVFLENKLFVVSGVTNTLTIALTNIVLILYFHMGIQSLYIAQIVGCLVQIIIIESRLHLIPNTYNKEFDFELLLRIIKFSFPLCVATVSYWLLSGYTKITINSICGSADNGLFAIATSFANMAVIAVNVFQFAWNETAYLMANEENRTSTYKKCLDLLFCTVWICCAAFCSIVNVIFPVFVGEAFQASALVIPYLMLGVSANAIAGFLGTLFMTEQKTSFIMISTLIAAGVNVAFSGLVTRSFGLIGAVAVLSVSFGALMILRMVQIKRKMNISITWGSAFSVLPVVISIGLYTYNAGVLLNVLFVGALAVCYFFIVQRITGIRLTEIIRNRLRGKEGRHQ